MASPKFINFNKDLFIEQVRLRPQLWKRKTMRIEFKQSREDAWDDISGICGLANFQVKKLWKNLRDQYRREFQRSHYGGFPTRWRYYEAMNFLSTELEVEQEGEQGVKESKEDDEVKLLGKVKREVTDLDEDDDDEYNEDIVQPEDHYLSPLLLDLDSMDASSSSKASNFNSASNKRKETNENNNDDEQYNVPNKRGKLEQEPSADSADLQFFKSLLPYVESFELLDRLELRNKIQALVLEKYRELNSKQKSS